MSLYESVMSLLGIESPSRECVKRVNHMTRAERVVARIRELEQAIERRSIGIDSWFPFSSDDDVCCQSCKWSNDDRYRRANERVERAEREVMILKSKLAEMQKKQP